MSERKETVYFLDTSALIPKLTMGHADHQRISQALGRSRAFIDALVLEEYLAGVKDDAARRREWIDIQRQFAVVPFGAESSLLAAKIFRICKEKNVVPKSDNQQKQRVKADISIIADAVLARADVVLFADGNFAAIGNALEKEDLGLEYEIPEFRDLKTIPYQPELPSVGL